MTSLPLRGIGLRPASGIRRGPGRAVCYNFRQVLSLWGLFSKDFMRHSLSLRAKLVLLAALIVSLASAPVIYLGYRDAYERSEQLALEKFNSISRIVDEETRLAYLNAQSMLSGKVSIEKENLRDRADVIEGMLSRGERAALVRMLQIQSEGTSHAAVIGSDGRMLYCSPLLKRAFASDAKDYLGVPLREYAEQAKKALIREGFSFFQFIDGEMGVKPMLLGVRVSDGWTVVMAEELDYISSARAERRLGIQSNLRDMIRLLPLSEGITVTVQSSSGDVIASKGPGDRDALFDEHPDVYAEAMDKGQSQGVLAGELLYSVRWFKAMDWYMQISEPQRLIARPAQLYAAKLVGIAVLIFMCVAVFGLWLINRFLTPLRDVALGARRLERVNFSGTGLSEQLRRIEADLPRGQDDEVGQVASAFSRLVRATEKNIAELKASLAHQHRIESELSAAREIQRGMLPAGDGRFASEGFEAAALMQAAKEVGGDFYDVFDAPDGRRVLVIGDVSGKGVSAALLMSVTLTLVRTAATESLSPAQVMKRVNDHLAKNNPNCMFVTLWIGLFDPATGSLVFANGGHCAPAVLSSESGAVRWLPQLSGPLVGVIDAAEFTDKRDTIAPDEICFVYTDGVSEAMNEKRELFGSARIESVLASGGVKAPEDAVRAMMDAILRHRGEASQSDDITMLAFARVPGERKAP